MIFFIMRVNVKTLAFAKGCVNDTWKSSVAAKFSSVYTPECDVLPGSFDGVVCTFIMAGVYSLGKC